jgi:hypothetical protein
MANLPNTARFGLPGIARLRFGMHVCHFYSNRDPLVAALVPYSVAGLRGNERCLWVTARLSHARGVQPKVSAASVHGTGRTLRHIGPSPTHCTTSAEETA